VVVEDRLFPAVKESAEHGPRMLAPGWHSRLSLATLPASRLAAYQPGGSPFPGRSGRLGGPRSSARWDPPPRLSSRFALFSKRGWTSPV
jgi:hypothetical protein